MSRLFMQLKGDSPNMFFFKVISLRISYSASQGNRCNSRYTQKGAPVTLHGAALHTLSFISVYPKGELVIVNYIRKANPV